MTSCTFVKAIYLAGIGGLVPVAATAQSIVVMPTVAPIYGLFATSVMLIGLAAYVLLEARRLRHWKAALVGYDHAGMAVAVMSRSGKLLFKSRVFQDFSPQIAGRDRNNAPVASSGKGLDRIDQIASRYPALCQALSDPRTQGVCPAEVFLDDGRVFEFQVRALSGKRRLALGEDVTARRMAEARAERRFASLKSQLEQSNHDLEEFAYVASHDLKEPLRGLTINADFLMREGSLGAGATQRVTRMVLLCNRMEQLISDLLFFSRLGRSEASREDVDLVEIVETIRVSHADLLEERSGTITIANTLPVVYAERAKMKTVLENLIVNALKYNDSLRKVVTIGFETSIEVGDTSLRNVFYVEDNGIGIDEKNHDKIFRIFSRLNSEKSYGSGSGAGLAFVKKIIEEYGNEITFFSQPGSGSTFYFSLPLVKGVKTSPFQPLKQVAG